MKRQPEIRFDQACEWQESSVWRYDLAELSSPKETAEGFLIVQGRIARAGVLEYKVRNEDGSVGTIRELRAPGEVFSSDSLRSFELAPLTLNHPPEILNPDNVAEYQVGAVSNVRQDGDHVVADIRINRRDAIEAAKGNARELSSGYRARVLKRSGVYKDESGSEHRFDSVQTSIEGNHVAIVERGRAGPTVALRMDSGDGEQVATPEGKKMKKIMLDGKEFEVPDEVADAFDLLMKKKEEESAAMEEEKKADSATIAELSTALEEGRGKIEALQAERATRADADKVTGMVSAELEARARLLDIHAKLGGQEIKEGFRKDSKDLRLELVRTHAPDLKIEGQSEAYLEGALQVLASRVDSAEELNKLQGNKSESRNDAEADPVEAARIRSVQALKSAGKFKAQA